MSMGGLRALLENPTYKQWVLDYLSYYRYEGANRFDFDTEGEYFEYIQANEIRHAAGGDGKGLG